MRRSIALGIAALLALAGLSMDATAAPVSANSGGAPSVAAQRVLDHWTPERLAQAIPRDLAIDPRGLAYLRIPGGALRPYGHIVEAQVSPMGATDTSFQNPDPAAGATIGESATFSLRVTDPDTVKTVSFRIQKAGGTVQSFSASKGANEVWSVSLRGFTSGDWSWWAVAKDGAARGGNTVTSTATIPAWSFTVDTTSGGGGGGGGDVVAEAEWTAGGNVQSAAGRIYFEMPANKRLSKWNGYICSGTAVVDTRSGQSLILTAAHCVYDDVNKAFARNVLFIPNQAGTTGSGTDRDCTNDPIGCWLPDYGVVHVDWTNQTFPNNVAWDFGFYVVQTSGRYSPGISTVSASLESAVPELALQLTEPSGTTYALGYSASKDPSFRYCSETLASFDSADWWLGSCGLSGGASGGPWMLSSSGAGPIFSVNSWGYTTSPGMAGPKFWNSKAECTYGFADTSRSFTPAARGYTTNC